MSYIGAATIHAVLLHFVLVLVGKSQIIRKTAYLLMYMPAFIFLYVYSLSPKMATMQYGLIELNAGLFNIAINSAWDWLYYLYYIVYMLIILVLLWQWKDKSDNKSVKNYINTIIALSGVTLIIGIFADIVLNTLVKFSMPQIAPIIYLIPLLILACFIRQHTYKIKALDRKRDMIISGENREKIYFYLSLLFLIGAILSSFPIFFPHLMPDNIGVTLINHSSANLYVIGVLILLFNFLRNTRLKDFLIIGLIILSIPIINIRLAASASITVWMYPIILMIVFLLFNERIPLILTIIVSLATQILLWRQWEVSPVIIDDFDFILRILFLILAFIICLVINNMYINRLKENDDKTKNQELIAEISANILNTSSKNLDINLEKIISQLGRFFDLDRVYVFIINQVDKSMAYGYEWCNENISPRKEGFAEVSLHNFTWWMGQLKEEKIINIKDMASIPREATATREMLRKNKTQSTLATSIDSEDAMLGFLGFDSIKTRKNWSKEEIETIKTISNIIGNGLFKIESERTIASMAYYDQLTGLPNHSNFREQLNKEMKVNAHDMAIILLDLDDFKLVNDYLGHVGGDSLLQLVAKRLKSNLHSSDILARFGGDEFLIMIDRHSELGELDGIASEIMDIFNEPINLQGNDFFVTASMGIAIYPTDGDNMDELTKNAEITMYEAKERGKNQYVFCSPAIKERAQKDTELSNDLHKAIKEEQLIIHYQPQININNQKIVGFEALLRWQHPVYGLIPPNVFIPLAEKNGAINEIGLWVLEKAAIQNKKWKDEGLIDVKMAINFSTIQFSDLFLVEKIEKIIKENKLEIEKLDIEITESSTAEGKEHLLDMLRELRDRGISISIDDFGVEYSSLSRLKTLPIDKLKIDMLFIRGIESNRKDRAIIKMIIDFAKYTDLAVLAEGVENQKQLDFLIENSCDMVQGYYYYRPLPAEKMEEVLRTLLPS